MKTFARAAGAVVLLGAGLAGCSTVAPDLPPPSRFGGGTLIAPEDATDAPMTYACRDGKRFVAAYALWGEHAVVSAGGGPIACRMSRRPRGRASPAAVWIW